MEEQPNLDTIIWTFIDRSMTDLERQGIYPTAGVADAVACHAGLMLTKQIRETAQTWLEMQKAIDESIPS